MKPTISLELIHGGRLTAAHAELERARLRAVVFNQALVEPHPQSIAKRNGVGYRGVLELVVEEALLRERKARREGFLAGQRSVWRPTPPSAGKRAA